MCVHWNRIIIIITLIESFGTSNFKDFRICCTHPDTISSVVAKVANTEIFRGTKT